MKTIITLFFSLLLVHLFAQQLVPVSNADLTNRTKVKTTYTNSKSLMDTLFYEDFDSTSTGGLPVGWTTVSLTNNANHVWIWSDVAPGGQYSSNIGPLASTSGSNGFLSIAADYYNTPVINTNGTSVHSYIESPPIVISPRSTVVIEWQHAHRYCCTMANIEALKFEYSTDGISWDTLNVPTLSGGNRMVPPFDSLIFPRTAAELKSISLPSLSNQTTVYLRFRWNENSHYFWMIDDLVILGGTSVGVEENNVANNSLRVVPNPNKGLFSIEFNQSFVDQTLVQVRNSIGQVVFEERVLVNSSFSKNIDLRDQESGLYFISVGEGNNRKVQKLVIQ